MDKTLFFRIFVIAVFLLFMKIVYSQNDVPYIVGGVSNSGSVNIGESIAFYGNCHGTNSALVVCKDNNICNLNSEFVRCKSDFSDSGSKSCSYQVKEEDIGLNDDDISTCCNSENLCDANTVSVEPWKAKKLVERVSDVSQDDLSSFPDSLRIRKEGDAIIPMNTTIIVGENAPSEDVVSAVELISGLGKELNQRIYSSLDSEISNDQLTEENLIVIGNSTINKYIADFSNEEANLPYFVSKIKLVNKDKNKIIYIIGKDSFYRRKAALALANYKNYDLLSYEVCITGGNQDVDDIEVIDCNNIQNIQEPALKQQSIEGQIETIQEEYIPEILITEKISLNKAECYDYEKKNIDCSNELMEEDKNTVSLITSKGRDTYVELEFDINNSDRDGTLFFNLIFKSYNNIYQTIPIYYHDGDLLKNICIISPNSDGFFETQNCEIKNYRNDKIKIRLEGISFKGDIRLEVDSLTLNHIYAKESLIGKTYNKILTNIKGSLVPNKQEEITLNGECEGENTKLIICNYGFACNLNNIDNILCQSDFTNDTLKQCTYKINQNSIDLTENYIGTCCSVDGVCDSTTVPLNRYDLKPPGKNKTIYETARGKHYLMNFTNIYPGANSFSVGLWLKVDYAHDGVILSTGEGGAIERYWSVATNSAGENNSLISVKLNSGQGEVVGYNKKNLLDGNWHNVVFVRDRFVSLVRIYMDGVFESEFYDATNDISDISSSLSIGVGNPESNDWFVGNVSGISIFNSILSEAEINASYTENY